MRRTLSTQYRSVRLGVLARLLALSILASAVGIGVVSRPGHTGPSGETAAPCPVAGRSITVVAPVCFRRVTRFDRSGLTPGTVLMRDRRPSLGEPCRNLYAHAAHVVIDANGDGVAIFTFAAGATTGRLPISAEEAKLAATRQPYMTDIQLGSYEPGASTGVLVCRLNPTFHFYCPATDTLDSLCLTWVQRRQAADGEGADPHA
jgi:hypothetical protein